MIAALSQCTRLSHIDIAWDDTARTTPLERLPNLLSARIVLLSTWYGLPINPCQWEMRGPLLAHNLTTIALYDRRDGYADRSRSRTMEELLFMQFSQLNTLILDGIFVDTRKIFLFIHRHPTILEANIIRVAEVFRLEALLALIDGTGTWYKSSWDDDAPVHAHQLFHTEYDPAHPSPPNISSVSLAIDEFAFVRTPTSPKATQWQIPSGSSKPRYRCTALSFRLLPDPDEVDNPEDYQPDLQYDLLNGLKTSGAAASISELRVFADEDLVPNLHDKVVRWMVRTCCFT